MTTSFVRGILCVLLAGLGWLFWPSRPLSPAAPDLINPVVGNASFRARFGQEPGPGTDENARIATHLAYVENLLRARDVRHLPALQRQRRAALLDHLHRYRTAGVFPRNEQYPGRRPCFIDGAGRICAVGYLVEQTAGRALAERVNAQHQYDYLQDMRTPELLAWVGQSGLSLRECAMIQPSYNWGPSPGQPNHVSAGYGAGSAVWSGLNAPLAALNGAQVLAGRPLSKGLAIAGVASGLGQAALGAVVLAAENPSFIDGRTNESKKAVCFLNIGLGTATAVLGGWNLLTPRPTPPRTTVRVSGYSSPAVASGGVLTLTRRF